MAGTPSPVDPKLVKAIDALARAYEVADLDLREILEAWDLRNTKGVNSAINEVISRLVGYNKKFAAEAALMILRHEYNIADQVLQATLPTTVSAAEVAALQQRYSRLLAQIPRELNKNLKASMAKAIKQGRGIHPSNPLFKEIRDEMIQGGVKGFARSGAGNLGIDASAKAVIRTETNRIQNEARLQRYGQHGVTHVIFKVGSTPCRYTGEGGSCEDLDGKKFPIDQIPSWAAPPRHLYSNSSWIPAPAPETPTLSEMLAAYDGA